MLGFLFHAQGAPVLAEVDHAVALGIVHVVGVHFRAGFKLRALLEQRRDLHAVENIVSEDQADRIAADEALADQEGLRDALGFGLPRHTRSAVQALRRFRGASGSGGKSRGVEITRISLTPASMSGAERIIQSRFIIDPAGAASRPRS